MHRFDQKDRPDSAVPPVADAAAFLCDSVGSICWWSDAAERLFGYAAVEAVGQSAERLLDLPACDASEVRMVRTRMGASRRVRRFSKSLQNGREGRLSLHLVWLEPDGESAGLPGPREDVGVLAARIAHDFSTLLAPVIGNVMLLGEQVPNDLASQRRVAAARQAAEDARGFAQRLAALDPRRNLNLQLADLAQLVQDLLPELRAKLPANIELTTDAKDDLKAARVDRKQMGHALVQLVLNAIEAMPAGGMIRVSIAVVEGNSGEKIPPPGSWVRLQVSDTGKGMDAALLRHAFEPFVSTKVPGCGVGLGLPSIATAVWRHQGVVDLRSSPGVGTTFSIFLPACGDLPVERVGHPPSAPVAASGAVAKASIVVVEDNAMVRRSIAATLRGLGYRVVAVGGGDECIETVRRAEAPIDLLITDVVMPHMSGRELIDRVHTFAPELPVLFMSGYDRSTLEVRKQPVPSEHFLQKPFDCDDLSAAVVKAMAASRNRTPD